MVELEVVCEERDEVEVDRVDVVEVFVHDRELWRVAVRVCGNVVGDADLVCVSLKIMLVNCSKSDCSGLPILSGNAEKSIESAFVVAAADAVMVIVLVL